MKAAKKIPQLIDTPRFGDVEYREEVSEESIELQGAKVSKQTYEPGKYAFIDIADGELSDVVLNNVSTFRSTVIRSVFTAAQCTGLQLPEGNFKNVIFKNCRMNLTNLRSSTFENCLFQECDLSEADFGMSHLTNVLFKACELREVDFSNCVMTRVEFEDTSLTFINGINGLKNASISEQNLVEIAPLLARELNIIIQ